ncbi:hypothetical protein [Actinoplanes aureus]|jgi:hypothetical protein|uniref:Uncharacterized protein n=1 Tax=Actinoplanes aureus TaxID=2792083 RepID=A0A931CDP3_9ACTN|nr:hypothetical protein [Actinoplanes aureus]MBG0564258.1 hypothetical protein [Actinoplanes aureus]
MLAEYVRDAAMTAAIFGFFAMAWFGWALEAPPPAWRRYLYAALTVSALAMAGGAVQAALHWSDGSVFDESVGRTYGIVVGIEFAVAGIGAALLGVARRQSLIPVWIALVVGVHMFPIAALLHYPAIHVVGVLITATALATIPISRATRLHPSAVVGVGTGVALLAGSLHSLWTTFLSW